MKRNLQKNEKNNIKKKSGVINIFNKNSLSNTYFNNIINRNKISIILDFLDINEQLPLIKLNSIISKIIINKYDLPFKSILPLRQYKNNKNAIESKYSNLYNIFKNIINLNNIEKEEYQYIISFLLTNMNNNYLIFDKLNEEINIFFDFLSKIKYIKNLNHIKFKISNADEILIGSNNLINNIYFINLFQNITNLEIDKIEKSFYFFNALINYEHNLINNIEKINLNNITVRIKNEISLKYDDYNSLLFPNLTNLKYIFLININLSVSFLNEIISNNKNLIKIAINNCSYNDILNNDENDNIEKINKNLNGCLSLKHIEFNKNNFSENFTTKIIINLISLFFNSNNIYMISCGFIKEIDFEEIYNDLIKYSNNILYKEKYLKIRFSPSFIYHINKNKRTIEISNYIKNISSIKKINYEKIKLCLYSTDNPNISNNIKKAMENFYKEKSTKYLQIFASFQSGELNQINNSSLNEYNTIEKFTLYFQYNDQIITLFGNNIILSILIFFPCIKIISFKNINFQNDDKIFREYFDDLQISIELILFGKKNDNIFNYFKNKNKKIYLEEIKFNNCYYYKNIIDKDILNEIKTEKYFGKEIKLSFID